MSEWTTDQVEHRFEACMTTLHRLPNEHYLGYSRVWLEVVRTPREMARHEPEPIRLAATPRQVTEMEETMAWLHWLNPLQRKFIWLRADRYSWREIAKKTGFPKTSAQLYWKRALEQVVEHLQAQRRAA